MSDVIFKVLLAGESWVTYGIHVKGFGAYTTGAYQEGLKPLAEALDGFVDLVYLPNHLAINEFPNSEDELGDYDVIILSDIGSDTLLLHPDTLERSLRRQSPLRAIQKYVENGGGFAMVGGYMSFAGFEGKANYRNTPIAEILPIVVDGSDDRVEVPEGFAPELAQADHPILKGIPSSWPYLLGYNRFVSVKQNSEVLLMRGSDPILVVGNCGRGRVAAFASDCSPHWGSPDFVKWDYYKVFWRQLLAWLAGRE